MAARAGLRLIALAAVAAAAFGVCDLAFSWNPLAAAPYLSRRAEPVFRAEPAYALGFAAECGNGWIAALAFVAVEPALRGSPWRRGAVFGAIAWGFWVVSGTFTASVWLAVPAPLALANVAFGLPKCVTIGVTVAWAWRRLYGANEPSGSGSSSLIS
jgi:hypothetical protein